MRRHQSFQAVRRFAVLLAATVLAGACAGGEARPSDPAGRGSAEPPGDTVDYPTGTIALVVPFTPGSPTDTIARLIAEPMGRALGEQVVVQNIEGAGGTVAAGQVAEVAPDGYGVLIHQIGMATAPALDPELEYDPLEDFETVGLVADLALTIVGRRDLEPGTLQELVGYVTTNGREASYGHAGVGAASHLCGLLFQSVVATEVSEVAYDGTALALDGLVDGQVDFLCEQTTVTSRQILAGEVKAYAVTTEERLEILPELPTTAEAGLPDVDVTVWHGLYLPAGAPDQVVRILSDALKEALTDETVVAELTKLGAVAASRPEATPEAHRRKLESEVARWGAIIEAAGVEAP